MKDLLRCLLAGVLVSFGACNALQDVPQGVSGKPLEQQLVLETHVSRAGVLKSVEVLVHPGARSDLLLIGLKLEVFDDVNVDGKYNEGEPRWYLEGNEPKGSREFAYRNLNAGQEMQNPTLLVTAHTSLGDVKLSPAKFGQ